MTVGELIEALQAEEPEREVYVTLENEFEVYDAPVISVTMRAGNIHVNGTED